MYVWLSRLVIIQTRPIPLKAWIRVLPLNNNNSYIYIYTYIHTHIYVCVCGWVCVVLCGESSDPRLMDFKILMILYIFSQRMMSLCPLFQYLHIFFWYMTCIIFPAPLSSPLSVYIRSSFGTSQINSYCVVYSEGGGVDPLKV